MRLTTLERPDGDTVGGHGLHPAGSARASTARRCIARPRTPPAATAATPCGNRRPGGYPSRHGESPPSAGHRAPPAPAAASGPPAGPCARGTSPGRWATRRRSTRPPRRRGAHLGICGGGDGAVGLLSPPHEGIVEASESAARSPRSYAGRFQTRYLLSCLGFTLLDSAVRTVRTAARSRPAASAAGRCCGEQEFRALGGLPVYKRAIRGRQVGNPGSEAPASGAPADRKGGFHELERHAPGGVIRRPLRRARGGSGVGPGREHRGPVVVSRIGDGR